VGGAGGWVRRVIIGLIVLVAVGLFMVRLGVWIRVVGDLRISEYTSAGESYN